MKGTYRIVTERIPGEAYLYRLFEREGTNGTEIEIISKSTFDSRILCLMEEQKDELESNPKLSRLEGVLKL